MSVHSTVILMEQGDTPTVILMEQGDTPTVIPMEQGDTPAVILMEQGDTPTVILRKRSDRRISFEILRYAQNDDATLRMTTLQIPHSL